MNLDVKASTVLLCLRYGIGDLIRELPGIDRLRETLPQATINNRTNDALASHRVLKCRVRLRRRGPGLPS